jgi:hypothetical protein
MNVDKIMLFDIKDNFEDVLMQRVLNDLWRTKLSRHRIIWLLPYPLLVSVSSTGDTQDEKERQLADGRAEGGGAGGATSNNPRESLVLNKAFNTLCIDKKVENVATISAEDMEIPRE